MCVSACPEHGVLNVCQRKNVSTKVVEKIEIHILGPVPFLYVHCMILKTNKNCSMCTCLNSCSPVGFFMLKAFVPDRFCLLLNCRSLW